MCVPVIRKHSVYRDHFLGGYTFVIYLFLYSSYPSILYSSVSTVHYDMLVMIEDGFQDGKSSTIIKSIVCNHDTANKQC